MRVVAVVEGTLARTAPGETFTAGVLMALPIASMPGATAAATAVSGASSGATSAMLAKLALYGGAFLGPLTGIVGAWAGYRASLAATRTPAEAAFLKRGARRMFGASVGLTGLILFLLLGLPHWLPLDPVVHAIVVLSMVLAHFIVIGAMIVRFRRAVGQLRQSERVAHPEAFLDERAGRGEPKRFRSRATFLGVPLVEVRYGPMDEERLRPAFAWFAFGDVAVGLIGAVGAVACAPLAFGAFSFGLAAIGGLSVAGCAIGAVAVGGCALGALAIGIYAVGGIAFGWVAAVAGVAVAREIAFGQVAQGAHANDAVSSTWLAAHEWLDVRQPEMLLTISLLWLPSVLITWLMIWRWRLLRRAREATPAHHS